MAQIDAQIASVMGVQPVQGTEQAVQESVVPSTEYGRTGGDATRPTHPADDSPDYTTICISLYFDDLASLEAAVKRCKSAGLRRMSKSQLIRIALRQLDLDSLIARSTGHR